MESQLQSGSCGFNSYPLQFHFQVITLGTLFSLLCLCCQAYNLVPAKGRGCCVAGKPGWKVMAAYHQVYDHQSKAKQSMKQATAWSLIRTSSSPSDLFRLWESLYQEGYIWWIWVSRYQNVSVLDFIGAKDDGASG